MQVMSTLDGSRAYPKNNNNTLVYFMSSNDEKFQQYKLGFVCVLSKPGQCWKKHVIASLSLWKDPRKAKE